jgi:hypothetical protein
MFKKAFLSIAFIATFFAVSPKTVFAGCILTSGNCPASNQYGCTAQGTNAVCCTDKASCDAYKAGGVTPVPKKPSGPPLEDCGIQTAIGCIPIQSEQSLAEFFLKWGMGIGGGIALILIVISTINIMTSGGDPRKLQVGKEMLTSAITGLLMLVFAAYILQFIGVDLLGIFKP